MTKEEIGANPDEDSFLQWALELGISDNPFSDSSSSCIGHTLFVANFAEAGGRGLGAARNLKKGELILRVPKAALMTSDCLMSKDCTFGVALRKYPLLSSTQVLAIALLNEVNKGKSTWWYPYLKQMPQSYDLIESFSRFEIEALQIDDAVWTAEKAVQKAKTEWEEGTLLMSELNLKPRLKTFMAWLWASATISSRTMHIPWDSAGCLCPVGDFFNYTPPDDNPRPLESSETSSFESEWKENSTGELFDANADKLIDAGYDEATGSYCFYAKRSYSKGDQVLLSYGTYTNLELLEHYGFVLQENPNDKAFIPLEPEMYSLCSWPNESLYICQDGKPSFALLSTVRLWATPPSKRRSVGHIVRSGSCISAENEAAVAEWITNACQVTLSSCATSIEDDKLLLRIIDKIGDHNRELTEYDEIQDCDPLCLSYGGTLNREVCGFLESNGVNSWERLHVSVKVRRSVDRWRLAVKWRCGYKRILSDCISHCNNIANNPQ